MKLEAGRASMMPTIRPLMTLPTALAAMRLGRHMRRIGHDDLDGDGAQTNEECRGEKRQWRRGKPRSDHGHGSQCHHREDELAIFKEIAQRHDQ